MADNGQGVVGRDFATTTNAAAPTAPPAAAPVKKTKRRSKKVEAARKRTSALLTTAQSYIAPTEGQKQEQEKAKDKKVANKRAKKQAEVDALCDVTATDSVNEGRLQRLQELENRHLATTFANAGRMLDTWIEKNKDDAGPHYATQKRWQGLHGQLEENIRKPLGTLKSEYKGRVQRNLAMDNLPKQVFDMIETLIRQPEANNGVNASAPHLAGLVEPAIRMGLARGGVRPPKPKGEEKEKKGKKVKGKGNATEEVQPSA